MKFSDVVVIIPAHNEAKPLPLVLAALPEVGMVIVANNNSTDATAEVAREGAKTAFASAREVVVKNFSGFYSFSLWLRSAWLFLFYWYAPALVLFSCRAGIETMDYAQKQCGWHLQSHNPCLMRCTKTLPGDPAYFRL